jgi:hypothetical protein
MSKWFIQSVHVHTIYNRNESARPRMSLVVTNFWMSTQFGVLQKRDEFDVKNLFDFANESYQKRKHQGKDKKEEFHRENFLW